MWVSKEMCKEALKYSGCLLTINEKYPFFIIAAMPELV